MSSARRLRFVLFAVFATLAVLLARPVRAEDSDRGALLRRIDYLDKLVVETLQSARHDPQLFRQVRDIQAEVSLLRAQVADAKARVSK